MLRRIRYRALIGWIGRHVTSCVYVLTKPLASSLASVAPQMWHQFKGGGVSQLPGRGRAAIQCKLRLKFVDFLENAPVLTWLCQSGTFEKKPPGARSIWLSKWRHPGETEQATTPFNDLTMTRIFCFVSLWLKDSFIKQSRIGSLIATYLKLMANLEFV